MIRMPSFSKRSVTGLEAGTARDNASNWRRSRLASLPTLACPLLPVIKVGGSPAIIKTFWTRPAFFWAVPLGMTEARAKRERDPRFPSPALTFRSRAHPWHMLRACGVHDMGIEQNAINHCAATGS
jgi:hypothetical protein